jgi:hypothetical protein
MRELHVSDTLGCVGDETPKVKDEVKRREVCECDGCDLEAMGGKNACGKGQMQFKKCHCQDFFFQGRMAGMFFPLCSEAQQLTTVQQPASLVLAGESSTIKTALLLQYAYNAALRGEELQFAVFASLQLCAAGLWILHRLPFSGLFSASPLARYPSSWFLVYTFC